MVQYDMQDVFKETFKKEGYETSVYTEGFFDASVYGKDGRELIQLTQNGDTYMVYINNPFAELDEDKCEVYNEETHEQWVFGEYKGFKHALNKCLAIIRAGKYPKPILKW